ncbi:glycoside hydrolase family 26 protein [Microbacteriaceae bacterium 4G12]
MITTSARVAAVAVVLALLGAVPAAAAPSAPPSAPPGAKRILSSVSASERGPATKARPAATSTTTTMTATATTTMTTTTTTRTKATGTAKKPGKGQPAPTEPLPTPTTRPATSTAPLRFGLMTPGGPLATAELDAAAVTLGESPSILMWYADFQQAPPIAELDATAARGATPLVTWEPWAWGGGAVQPAYASDRITAGTYDAHIATWGRALAAWGKPVLLRYGHEMNGPWYPWSDGVNGNGTGDYVAAWRHVHDVVAATGASNVQWVWSPNVPDGQMPAFSTLYPGSSYVDVVALDGYNWGTTTSWSSWTSPSALFGGPLEQLRAVAPGKPIMIGETSSAEAGGDKAAWSRDLIAYLSSQPDVTAVVWFNVNKETDWRFDSSPAAATSLREALAARTRT